MNILLYLKALFPMLEKNKILEDLDITNNELEKNILPSYSDAADYFRLNKITSADTKDLINIFYRNFDLKRSTKQSNIISELNNRIKNLIQNTNFIKEQIEITLEKNIINDGLSAKKVSLIRSAEYMSFLTKYLGDFLNYVYVNEAIAKDSIIKESMELSPASIKYVNQNLLRFARIFSDYSIDPDDYKKLYAKIPEISLSSKTENSINGLYTEKEIDPYSSGLVSHFSYNPIYHIRMVIAEWQTNRYNANKEKKKILELRLLYLKMKKDDKNDAALEKEINYLQGRIDNLERKMRDVEDSLD